MGIHHDHVGEMPQIVVTQTVCTLIERQLQLLVQYAVGRLIVAGDNRYLSGDLLELMTGLLCPQSVRTRRNSTYFSVSMSDHFTGESFFAPGATYEHSDTCTLLRNPHIARNKFRFSL